jgi:hypothetical protein
MKRKLNINLHEYTGTTKYHRFSMFPNFPVATDGVIAPATEAECFWLLDAIGSYQGNNKKLDPEFQVWVLKVNHDDDTAVLRGYNDKTLIVTQKISYTDFPLDKIKLYLMDNVFLLPSER